MRAISFGAFLWNAFWYLFVTGFVLAALFDGYVFDLNIGAFGATLPTVAYLFPLAFIAYKTQGALSRARGFGRFADLVISVVMLAAIGSAITLWVGIPFVVGIITALTSAIGVTLSSEPNDYKLAVIFIFGPLTLADVVGRDIFGWWRQSRMFSGATSSVAPGVRREDITTGAHGDLPDAMEHLDSRSTNPLYHAHADGVIEVNRWFVRDPFSGELVPAQNVPARLQARVFDRIAGPTALPAPPATNPGTGGATGAGGGT